MSVERSAGIVMVAIGIASLLLVHAIGTARVTKEERRPLTKARCGRPTPRRPRILLYLGSQPLARVPVTPWGWAGTSENGRLCFLRSDDVGVERVAAPDRRGERFGLEVRSGDGHAGFLSYLSGNPALRAPSTIRWNSLRKAGWSEVWDPSCTIVCTVNPGLSLRSSATAAAASAGCPRQA